MNMYTKMYGWLFEAFGAEQFTMDEFKAIFPSPQHAKIIHDLINLGYLTRIKRGKYKVVAPKEFLRRIIEDNLKQESALIDAKRKYAFCGNDAVRLWTDGYYWTGFTKGFKPIHIKILRKDLNYWKDFFKNRGIEFSIEDENRTLFGLMYVLHPVKNLRIVLKDDIKVVPLKEVVDFCKANELTYRPALEYLDEKYDLNMFENYEHLH